MKIVTNMRRLLRDGSGATTIEYGLILAMVFLAMIGAAIALGDEETSLFDMVSSSAVGAMQGAV
jgi:pilus assembly protein Flp/PilA